ncbi:DUF3304 domain-containing protein [Chromobacterium amazonense]|nr:DUF3304 domain-containing protein [Chromobacterium amazonense]MDE1716293.1 DUF3304 domain-containing protein [Chromobacterium amazonense]
MRRRKHSSQLLGRQSHRQTHRFDHHQRSGRHSECGCDGRGGADVCCVTVPKTWRPGLTVKIGWENDGDWLRDKNGEPVLRDGKKVYVPVPWKFRTVPIPEYTAKQRQHFDIHFLPGDQVMVKLSDIFPEHKDYRPTYPIEKKAASQ